MDKEALPLFFDVKCVNGSNFSLKGRNPKWLLIVLVKGGM